MAEFPLRRPSPRGVAAAFAVIFLLLVAADFWYTVDQGDRGVLLRFGRLADVTEPGLHFKLPLMENVEIMSVRTQKIVQKISIYSKDIQAAEIALSINYSLDAARVGDIYSRYGSGYASRVILPQILAKPKDVFGKYNAVDIVQNRERLAGEIKGEFDRQFADTGIFVESVQIENIDFSDEYEKSVEERMKAEVEVQKVKQNLEREKLNADMVRTRAQGEADARIARARADAEALRLVGGAEAEAIRWKAAAMAENPAYVRLVEAQRWNGVLPATMLPLGTVPIVDAGGVPAAGTPAAGTPARPAPAAPAAPRR